MPELLTTKELARVLAVGPETIRAWAAAGRIPEIAVNDRCKRYELAEVLRALRRTPAQTAEG